MIFFFLGLHCYMRLFRTATTCTNERYLHPGVATSYVDDVGMVLDDMSFIVYSVETIHL
jgi:hypothetical protein